MVTAETPRLAELWVEVFMILTVGGKKREAKVFGGVPEHSDAPPSARRHTLGENIAASFAFNEKRLTPAAAFNCCNKAVTEDDIVAALGYHTQRRYSE